MTRGQQDGLTEGKGRRLYRLMLTLRGLWWRRGLTCAVLAVATITTASAALGPLYARAAAESTLHDQLAAASVNATGLHYQETTDVASSIGLQSVLDDGPAPGKIPGYPTRIAGIYTATSATGPAGLVNTGILWRQGVCGHLVITSGVCPSRPGQALVSARTVTGGAYGWHLGVSLTLGGVSVGGLDANGFPIAEPAHATIVGTYRPVDTADPYWFGQDYFNARGATQGTDRVDSLVVAPSEFRSLVSPTSAEVDVDLPVAPGRVHWSAVPALLRGVDGLANRYSQGQGTFRVGVRAVINQARHQRRLVNTGTTLVTLQLGLLAWLVLFQVVTDAAEARGNEVALAKLRGRGPLSTLRFGLSEPLALLALAIPFGLALAVLVVHVFAATVLAVGTPVVLPADAVAAAFVAFAGGGVAALLAGQRTLTRSALEQWRRTTGHARPGRLGLAVDVVLAALAVTALVLLRKHHHTGTGNDSAALLAPGLLVSAVALLGVRLLPPLCRVLIPATRSTRRVGWFLAVRQVARRPAGLRLAALLAIALGLATFAVAGETVALANRDARARAEVGAPRVVSVQYEVDHDPVVAVAKADPGGRWAMAAATWLPDGGDTVTGTVLGVDGSRFTSVASAAAGGPGVAAIATALADASVRPVTVTAAQVRITVAASDLSPGVTPTVQLNLRTATNRPLAVPAGALRAGTHDYVAQVACAPGCTLWGITWDRPINADAAQTGTAEVTGIASGDGHTWTPLDVGLTRARAWRAAVPIGHAKDTVHITSAGVADRFENDNGGYGGLTYAATPSPIPIIATRRGVVSGVGAPTVPAVADVTQTAAPVAVRRFARVLPGVLDDGIIADVRYLSGQLPDFATEARWQVWLGPNAPADAVARLQAAGLITQRVRSTHGRVIELGRQGPALALLLLLGCAIAGTVLAVGGTAISVSASSRRRSFELAALRAIGISRNALLRAGVWEQLLLLGTAVVLGVPGGVVAARLAIPAIPEFSDSTPVQLHYGPPVLPVLMFTGAFVVLLAVTAVIAARSLVRAAVPARLREDEQ